MVSIDIDTAMRELGKGLIWMTIATALFVVGYFPSIPMEVLVGGLSIVIVSLLILIESRRATDTRMPVEDRDFLFETINDVVEVVELLNKKCKRINKV